MPPIVLALALAVAALLIYDAAVAGGRHRGQVVEAGGRGLEIVRLRLERIWRG